jgi:hypothetical protein
MGRRSRPPTARRDRSSRRARLGRDRAASVPRTGNAIQHSRSALDLRQSFGEHGGPRGRPAVRAQLTSPPPLVLSGSFEDRSRPLDRALGTLQALVARQPDDPDHVVRDRLVVEQRPNGRRSSPAFRNSRAAKSRWSGLSNQPTLTHRPIDQGPRHILPAPHQVLTHHDHVDGHTERRQVRPACSITASLSTRTRSLRRKRSQRRRGHRADSPPLAGEVYRGQRECWGVVGGPAAGRTGREPAAV